MYTTFETGLTDQWTKAAIDVVYNLFVDKDFIFNLKTNENVMVLDEIKIAIGPYMLGIVLAFVALLFENFFRNNAKNEKMTKLTMKKNAFYWRELPENWYKTSLTYN